jgi:hypothetical protein
LRWGQRTLQPFRLDSDFAPRFVSVAIGNRKSKIENLLAGVVQWQNGSFPSCTRGFDSPHPLIPELKLLAKRSQLFIGAHNEKLSVALSVSNEDRSPM